MYPLLHYGMAPEDFDFELLLAHVDSRIGALYRTPEEPEYPEGC